MSMTITLPEHIQTWIDQQVAEGRYDSEEAVIASAVEQVMDPPYRWDEDQNLLEAIAEYERDGGETVTDIAAFLERLSEEARQNSRRGVPVPYDVSYWTGLRGAGIAGYPLHPSVHRRHVDSDQEEAYRQLLRDAFVRIQSFPEIGHPAEGQPSDVREYHLRHHVIQYRREPDRIVILRIVNSRRRRR